MSFEFVGFPKMARLSRECVITEKIDGTNASVFIAPVAEVGTHHLNLDSEATLADGFIVLAGSRNRWISMVDDNYGFARWVRENRAELLKLGPGHHFGEWWGAGIQRRYGLTEKRFSLFNVGRWMDVYQTPVGCGPGLELCPACCHVVPVLYRGPFNTTAAKDEISYLRVNGSVAAPGFTDPEGIVVWHEAAKVGFKKTIIGDEKGKAQQV